MGCSGIAGELEHDRAVLGEGAGAGEDPRRGVADRLRLLAPGALELGQRLGVVVLEQLVDRLGAAALELADQAGAGPGQQADRAALDRARPAAVEEAAARALAPGDRLGGLLVGEPVAEDPLERLQRRLAALVREVDDHAGAAVDLKRDRRLAECLLVQPAVGRELELDRRVAAAADAAGELRVADRVAGAGGEEEVGDADDLDLGAGERRLGSQRALVDHPLVLGDQLAGALGALVDRQAAEVDVVREAGEVPALVLGAELHQHLRVRARGRLLDVLGAQPDPQVALRGAVEREEVGRDQARPTGRAVGGGLDARILRRERPDGARGAHRRRDGLRTRPARA